MTTAPSVTLDSIVIGRSARMRAVFEFLRVIGTSDSTVLVTGESGTGKEVTATLIHQASRRKHQPFVAVSCALFSETLIESELFGHERGAFTGAVKDRPGRFELADGGTLFLDDIDDVPLSMQVKLLRVLQNRTIERLGGTRTVPVNVRIIAGSKKDLKQMVAGRHVPRGSVLPAQRHPGRAAAAARAPRRHSGADGTLHRALLPPQGRRRAADLRRGAAGVSALPLAGQRARARERVRADRADLHVRHGADRLRRGEHSAARRRSASPELPVAAPLDRAAAGRRRRRRGGPAADRRPRRSRSTIAFASSKRA